MLSHLSIRNLAVIAELDLDLAPGFCVLTGETGAGKSILIDAIGLVLGTRADSDAVRSGAKRAEVTAEFDLSGDTAARNWLGEHALDDPDQAGLCVLRRVVAAEGGSRGFINGSPATVAQLRALGGLLLDIHGQHDSQRLLRPSAARTLLDGLGDYEPALTAVREAVEQWQAAGHALEALGDAGADASQQIEFLRFQLDELERIAPQDAEIEQLDAEHRQLANADRLIQDTQRLSELLDGDSEEAVTGALHTAAELAAGLQRLDPRYAGIAELIDSARIQAQEAASDAQRQLDALELDPERLAQVEQRLAELHQLARKHHVEADALHTLVGTLREQLDTLENRDARRATLLKQQADARNAFQAAARALSTARTKAGQRLADQVTTLLRPLGMPDALVEVAVEHKPDSPPALHGADRVELRVSANPGLPPRPLAKVASGGELSRISLALQLASVDQVMPGCMIFDEVDAGIGGGVAEIVGRQLRALGQHTQVLCVTHLPQVAAQAGTQLHVRKRVADGATHTGVERLGADARVEELARMLGGVEQTAQTLAHAREMLEQAAA